MKKTYLVANEIFDTQKKLNDKISGIINKLNKNTLFHNEFLQSVVNELHPDCVKYNQKSNGDFYYLDTKGQIAQGFFRKETKGQNMIITYFEPLNKWLPVTLFPHKYQSKNIVIQDFIAALRKKSVHFLPEKTKSTKCSVDGCTGKQIEYHHVSPSFKEMAEQIMKLFSDDELDNKFGYCKFNDEDQDTLDKCIPNDHAAVLLLKELHQNNKYVWLCKNHHADITYKRGAF